eukprot:351023-Chlamydomonas_euryale.AAC.1
MPAKAPLFDHARCAERVCFTGEPASPSSFSSGTQFTAPRGRVSTLHALLWDLTLTLTCAGRAHPRRRTLTLTLAGRAHPRLARYLFGVELRSVQRPLALHSKRWHYIA